MRWPRANRRKPCCSLEFVGQDGIPPGAGKRGQTTHEILLELADHGLEGACARHAGLRQGVNTYNGNVTHRGVAESQGREWRELAPVE